VKDSDNVTIRGRHSDSTIRFGPVSGLSGLVDPERTVIVADELTSRFIPAGFSSDRLAVVERGETAKSLASLETLYTRFLELGVGRDWTVIGIGGGSISDLAGFAASTWLRGIDFGFVPTTLLAMVDASVGGKNGIDFGGYKNLVGSFSQPRFVQVDTALLSGLPGHDLACGLVEAIKHGWLDGEAHMALIERVVSETGSIDLPALLPVIKGSITLKAAVVNADEREQGDRRKLNLGHTIGHGVEAATGLSHGACVAVGFAAALRFALERGNQVPDAPRVIRLLERLGLPVSLEGARRASRETSEIPPVAFRDAVALAVGSDKKKLGDQVLFVMPLSLGTVRVEAVQIEDLRDFIRRTP